MRNLGRLIPIYVIRTILPYFAFSWLLLTVILFVQQASRFSDIFFSVNIPASLVWQLSIAIVPSVIAFTCPMAILVGTIIGINKLQGDSELVAIRASGLGNLQVLIPIVLLGILLSLFAFLVNLVGVPVAAAIVRKVALQAAIKKLESPVEPGVFNTEIAGYTIFVRGGDVKTGRWNDIFVYSENPDTGAVRLITSGEGGVDVTNDSSELVLENASSYSLPPLEGPGPLIYESIGTIRLAIKTKRNELISRLASTESSPEELGLAELASYADAREGREKTEAQLLWQRRILLSVTPLIFCLLGASMSLRFSRGGRGFGIFLALASLIIYYLTAFFGEQMARTGRMSVPVAGLLPVVISSVAIIWFLTARRRLYGSRSLSHIFDPILPKFKKDSSHLEKRNLLIDLTTGLRDLDIVLSLLRYFFLALAFLSAIFLVFTAFELWKFAGTMESGVWLLSKYLFFLLPFVYLQLAPSSAMIAILAAFVIKSRQNEIVTWSSAGQSIYRLLFPCFVLAVLLGIFNWQLQESVLPQANRTQDELRNQIRSLGILKQNQSRNWYSVGDRIYSFALSPDKRSGGLVASDNEITISRVIIFEFGDKQKLQLIYRYPGARWDAGKVTLFGEGEQTTISLAGVQTEKRQGGEIIEATNPFLATLRKPTQLNSAALRQLIRSEVSEAEKTVLEVSLHRKYSTIVLPLVIALFTAPFSLSLSRRGKVITVGYAIGLWLVFTASTSVFEQFGASGLLDPRVAVWGPLGIFSMLGLFLLARVRA